ncbi:MAG: hypothetical protein K8U57_18035 [Planctomycetes bacterium]|nr:hypothetical protein [Planctomycetota bacterium]
MPESVLLEQLHLSLFLPIAADKAVVDAARAALDDPQFLDSVHTAVRNVLDAIPALAPLSAAVDW